MTIETIYSANIDDWQTKMLEQINEIIQMSVKTSFIKNYFAIFVLFIVNLKIWKGKKFLYYKNYTFHTFMIY